MDLRAGMRVANRYEIVGPAGEGPAYRAYFALDHEAEVEIQLWLVRPELLPDAAARTRFVATAAKARSLTHPNLRRVHDVGITDDDTVYISVQKLRSLPLDDIAAGGKRLHPEEVLHLGKRLAAALSAAHAQGMGHGRMGPHDVETVDGEPKLSGVGLWGALAREPALKAFGEAMGPYLAPEVRAGHPPTPAADVYGLALVLAELSVGLPVKAFGSAQNLATRLLREHPALAAALAEEPTARPATPRALLEAMGAAPEAGPDAPEGQESVATAHWQRPAGAAEMAAALLRPRRPSNPPPPPQPGGKRPSTQLPAEPRAASARPVQKDGGTLPSADPDAGRQSTSRVARVAPGAGLLERRKSGGRGVIFAVMAVVILGGGAVAAVKLWPRADKPISMPPVAPPADAAPPPPPPPPDAGPPPADAGPPSPCPEGMVYMKGSVLCIDRLEAPGRPGQLPELGVSLEGARAACQARGAKLCTGIEWERACRGKNGASYPYALEFAAGKCNVRGTAAVAVGSLPECVSGGGAMDMSGNAAEWVDEGTLRGDSFADGGDGRCSRPRLLPRVPKGAPAPPPPSDAGYRCCAPPGE